MDQRRSPRWINDHRLGIASASAIVLAAIAGTLAAASPAMSPTAGFGTETAAEITSEAAPQWTDGFDHVVVTSARSAISNAPATTASDTGPVPSDEQLAAALRAVDGVQSVNVVAPGTYAVATAGDRAALPQVPGVVGIVDDILLTVSDDPLQSQQWALANTGAPEQSAGLPGIAGADANVVPAWSASTGAGVVVAVVDTGVQAAHPDLSGRMWANSGEVCANGVDDDANGFVDDCNGWDFGMNDADPGYDTGTSGYDHGTHVAGIIAAGRNGVGVVGVAPDATIMAVKASLSSNGSLPMSSIVGAIQYAADNGATVVNMSFGTGVGTPRDAVSLMEGAVQYALDRGVTLVAAAGNSGADISTSLVFPAAFSLYYDGVITVGSTTNTDTRSSFSNYGTPISIYAPGSFILSTVAAGGYGYKSGTSMATPMVVGAVAAMRSLDPTLTPVEVRTAMVATSRTLSWGGSMLDVAAAVNATPPAPAPSTPEVVYESADTIAADRTGTLGVRISAAALPAGVTGAKLNIATLDAGTVYAVDGLSVVVGTGTGNTTQVTGVDGTLPAVSLDASTALSVTEWRFTLTASLPAGSYAVVTDLVDGSGATVGGSFAGYLQVSAAPSTTTTIAGATTTTGATATTVRATTTVAGATTTAAGVTTTTRVATTTTAAGATTTTGATATTVRATTTTAAGATTTVRATTTTAGVTTTRAATTTATPTTVAGATTTTSAAGGVVTTTPTPSTVVSGVYRISSMSPRTGSTAGGTAITISGAFPTTVPVYVWFGTAAVAPATVSASGATLTLTSPQALAAGVVDVTVRFTTSQSYALVYSRAYTYALPGSVPATTVAGGTTTVAPTTTRAGVTTTTRPATTSTISPTTTVAVRTRGAVRLRPPPTTGAMSRLNPVTWPAAACTSASCPATPI